MRAPKARVLPLDDTPSSNRSNVQILFAPGVSVPDTEAISKLEWVQQAFQDSVILGPITWACRLSKSTTSFTLRGQEKIPQILGREVVSCFCGFEIGSEDTENAGPAACH